MQWLKDGGQFDYDMRQKAAFAAGWKARKAAQYAGMIKRKPRTIVRKTFFPTMELGDDC